MRNKSVMVAAMLAAGFAAGPAMASDTLVKFEGGVGVHPVANTGIVNTVRGVAPGGRPWGILKLKATIKQDGSIRAKGEGLVLAATDAAGTRGGILQVAATLFCDAQAFSSPAAEFTIGGDFEIRGQLTPVPSSPCNNPALLIRNATGGTLGAWFAVGILDD